VNWETSHHEQTACTRIEVEGLDITGSQRAHAQTQTPGVTPLSLSLSGVAGAG
jgi:hypothetical protein